MNPEILFKLEKAPYPTGLFAPVGEHLRVFTQNESNYIPPVRIGALASKLYPIIVPTRRNVLKNRKNILRIMRLVAGRDNTLLIFLCSGTAVKEDVALLADEFPDLQWTAIDGPFPYDYHQQNFETTYSPLSYGGDKDIGQKRNFGLQLARRMGWEVIVFLDDDIVVTNAHLDKALDLLQYGKASVVGFNARLYPDLSVAMHAHRWLHNSIDNFLGTGIMAIKTNESFLSFFPHVYNEDWLFVLLYRLLDEGNLVWAGSVRQARYNPYRNVQRARIEEAGDLLGESLFKLVLTLCGSGRRFKNLEDALTTLVEHATEEFWNMEINNRLDYLHGLLGDLSRKKMQPIRRRQAKMAILSAIERIVGKEGKGGITGEDLAAWVQAWSRDVQQWNAIKMPKATSESVAAAIAALELPNGFIDHVDPIWLALSTNPVEPRVTQSLRKHAMYEYTGFTVQPRNQETMQMLWMTKLVQDYLAEKHLSVEKIITSANKIRFDRPVHSLIEIKPRFTISMVVSYGESVAQIRTAVQDIVRWTKKSGPLQLVIWVYDNSSKISNRHLEAYRNRVVAQLVHDITGTHVQLRSSTTANKDKNISEVIDTMLNDISFAYWKCNIAPDHPIYVTNSRNELLRLGTFCQFMHHEHTLPRHALKHQLRETITKNTDFLEITSEQDEAAIYVARSHFAEKSRKRWPFAARSSTAIMLRRMRRARLKWVQLDDLAFNVQFYSPLAGDSMIGVKRTECIPVLYKKDLPSNKQAVAREIIRTLKNSPSPEVSYMIVVRGQADDSWEQLEQYRSDLMEIVTSHAAKQAIFSSLTYRLLPNETDALFKKRILAITSYIHWLQNDPNHVQLLWRPQLLQTRFGL
jgi:hypothetical protein